jgi:hypothetical protein
MRLSGSGRNQERRWIGWDVRRRELADGFRLEETASHAFTSWQMWARATVPNFTTIENTA